MSDDGAFLAIDWGTTNRRAYRIERGVVVASERDDRGVTAVAAGGFEAELAGIRERLGDLPVLMAGMVGSTIGWQVAPYVAVPAGIEALATGILRIDERTAIVPGVSLIERDRGDVMRGEEVQLLGAVAAGLAPADGLLCQPGTHCKWVDVRAGVIVSFTTAMTGELFALLRTHGILAAQLGCEVAPGGAFMSGVSEGAKRDLTASLFGIRAAKLTGLRDDADAAAYASGVLIGADVAARIRQGDYVHVLADPALGALYAQAIETLGGTARVIDTQAAFVAGMVRLKELIA